MLNKTKLELWFNRIFNTHAVQDGTPPYTHYIDSFDKSDFGISVRIEEGLAHQTTNIELFILIATILILLTIIMTGIILYSNQRKIRKELRQLREMMENQDKPQE